MQGYWLCQPVTTEEGRLPAGVFLVDPEPLLSGEVSLLWAQTDLGVVVQTKALAKATCRPGQAPQVTSCRLRRAGTWIDWRSDKRTPLPAEFLIDRVFVYQGWAFAKTPLGGDGWTRAEDLACASSASEHQPLLGSWVPLCRTLYGAPPMGDETLRVGLIRAPAIARVLALVWGLDGNWTAGFEVVSGAVLVEGRADDVTVQTTIAALQRARCSAEPKPYHRSR
jgi:hypothetical protein